MRLLEGKSGIIMGVANERSIATSIARLFHANGARLAFSYLPDRGERTRNYDRISDITKDLQPELIQSCDVADDDSMLTFFSESKKRLENIDFVIHSIAYAPSEDMKKSSIDVSRHGFQEAMDISVYSFMRTCNLVKPFMNPHGSLCAMSYFGSEKVMPGYNLMGICKAALDAAVRYAALDMGDQSIRVNAISAGPIKTLAASAISDFKKSLSFHEKISPIKQNVSAQDVANTAVYLCSDLSKLVTGEIIHVDSGFNIMGPYEPSSNL